MGYIKPKKARAKGNIKVIDPRPWQVEIQREGKSPKTMYMNREKAEEYFKAGHRVKLVTTAGELRNE